MDKIKSRRRPIDSLIKRPKVSVVCVSYNQERYIRQAIDSFLMQETDFTYEIIIADDFSQDNTRNILLEYAGQYPDIIKLKFQDANVGVAQNFKDALTLASGEYIALCEGDDYWTSPLKLQMQAVYLDNNKNTSICFHKVKIIYGTKDSGLTFPDTISKKDLKIEKLIRSNFIQTNSVMYRTKKYDKLPVSMMPVDWYLHLFHAKGSEYLGYLPDVLAAYRRHEGGVWWESDKDLDKIWIKYGIAHLSLYIELSKLFSSEPRYQNILSNFTNDMLETLIRVDDIHGTEHLKEAMDRYSSVLLKFLVDQQQNTKNYINEITNLRIKIESLTQDVMNLNQEVRIKQRDIDVIKSSKLWKIRNIYRAIINFRNR
jgi:glycosyltransferase involved in cell wall biosynthesis